MSPDLEDNDKLSGLARRLETSRQRSRIARWAAASTTYRTVRVIGRAWEFAVVTSILRLIGRWARTSLIFRWLTADSEPAVIIDLRGTYTVAPFLTLLDRAITTLLPSYRRSRVRRLSLIIDQADSKLGNTRVGRLLTTTLTPPESPDGTAATEHIGPEETDKMPAADDGFHFPES